MGKWMRRDEDVLLDTVVRTGPSEGQMSSKSWDGVSHVAIGGKGTGGRGRVSSLGKRQGSSGDSRWNFKS